MSESLVPKDMGNDLMQPSKKKLVLKKRHKGLNTTSKALEQKPSIRATQQESKQLKKQLVPPEEAKAQHN